MNVQSISILTFYSNIVASLPRPQNVKINIFYTYFTTLQSNSFVPWAQFIRRSLISHLSFSIIILPSNFPFFHLIFLFLHDNSHITHKSNFAKIFYRKLGLEFAYCRKSVCYSFEFCSIIYITLIKNELNIMYDIVFVHTQRHVKQIRSAAALWARNMKPVVYFTESQLDAHTLIDHS